MAQKKNHSKNVTGVQPTRENKVVRGRPSSVTSEPKTGKKKKKKMKVWKKVLIVVAIILVVLVVSCYALFQYIFGGLNIKTISENPEDLGINTSTLEKYQNSKVTNIALFGVDTRSATENVGRSDSIMILSIDQKNNVLKLTSILRDSKVSIEGHGQEKITHAYAYGGPELAIKTLNQNFDLDIQDYATVNFTQLANVIDAMGGIDIEITEAEREQININANSEGMSAPEVTSSGMVHLNGAQATAYARIRAIDSDNARADRQKKVMECLLNNVKDMSVLEYPKVLKTIMPMVETSMSYTEIMSFAPMLLKDLPLEQNSVPNDEDNAVGGGNPWVWTYDLEAATDRLHRFIYGDTDMVANS
jgi:LCP family protein required for cell wall assembly